MSTRGPVLFGSDSQYYSRIQMRSQQRHQEGGDSGSTYGRLMRP